MHESHALTFGQGKHLPASGLSGNHAAHPTRLFVNTLFDHTQNANCEASLSVNDYSMLMGASIQVSVSYKNALSSHAVFYVILG